jgi:hypothetical protein
MIGVRKPVLREDEINDAAAGGEVPRTSVEPAEPQPGKAKLPPVPPTRREFSLGLRAPDGWYGSGW